MGDDADIAPPRANPLLLGQDAAEASLGQAWRSGRLAHAWLITGPRGVGKATLAYRFARFVLAGGKGEGKGIALPGSHPVFRRVASGGHADFRVLEREVNPKTDKLRTEILVEQVRGLGSFLRLTPSESAWRVAIVDSADELNPNAANALLKVLEEPPARALLLLVAHAPGRLLPTIRSRCRRLALPPLDDAAMNELLQRYAPSLAGKERATVLRLADGSIGRALDFAAGDGLAIYGRLSTLLRALPETDVPALHAMADKFGGAAGEPSFRIATELLLRWLERMIRGAASGVTPAEVAPGEAGAMARLAAAARLDRWLELWEKTARLFAGAEELNLDRKQVWIGAFLEIEALARG
jgi:DNA polymerase III subunit delta'